MGGEHSNIGTGDVLFILLDEVRCYPSLCDELRLGFTQILINHVRHGGIDGIRRYTDLRERYIML